MATEDTGKFPRFSQLSKTKQLEWKRKMLLFSFFLVVAVIIWLLNALSKNYTTDIKYPITYSRFPQNKILVSDVPDHLLLKVNAHGYALLSYKLTNRPIPISFQVTNYAMNRMDQDTSMFYILTRYARAQVSRQLPAELQLQEISPDSLVFRFANEVRRKVPVDPKLDYRLEKNFTMVDGVEITPDSVWVTGPDIYLDTLQFVRTESLALGVLQKSYSGILKVDEDPGLSYKTTRIACMIDIEKLTEVQVQVKVQISGLPDSLRMQTFPQKVRVTGKVGLSKYDRIVPEAFWIGVDYHDIAEGNTQLPVTMRSRPQELRDADFYPRSVEYLLSVK